MTAGAQLERRIAQLATVGAEPAGGVYRGAYDPAQLRAERLVADWMEEAGLRSRRDAAGNLWGAAPARTAAPAIVVGSHLDSVRGGGAFDGVYGVLAAISAVGGVLAKHGTPPVPVEVVAFAGEEGSRFPIGLLGSRLVAGEIGRNDLEGLLGHDGTAIEAAFEAAGLDLDRVEDARRDDIGAYLELHIEQGPVLEAVGADLGLVEAIVGIHQFSVHVAGRADHGGTTPMDMRRDALVAAAGMVTGLRDLAADRDGMVLTVGRFVVGPGAPNVVPDAVDFTVDIRHHDRSALGTLADAAAALCRGVGDASGVGVEWREMGPLSPPAAMAPELVALLEELSGGLGLTAIRMPSRAGHDAKPMAGICPTGMLFVPSVGGRSHTPTEQTATGDLLNGERVLRRAVHALAFEDRLGLLSAASTPAARPS